MRMCYLNHHHAACTLVVFSFLATCVIVESFQSPFFTRSKSAAKIPTISISFQRKPIWTELDECHQFPKHLLSSTITSEFPKNDDLLRQDESDGIKSDNKLSKTASGSLSKEAIFYMTLLAIQFGVQPVLVRAFTAKSVCKSSFVLVQEFQKLIIASMGLYFSGEEVYTKALKGWNLNTAVQVAGIPAILYAIQGIVKLIAYQNLQPLTFNVLNQTKTLSAALCCYLVMGRKQSKMQMLSLILLLGSALVIEKIVSLSMFTGAGLSGNLFSMSSSHFTYGVLPILVGSFLSGLAGALSQKNLQGKSEDGISDGRNAYLFSMEINAFSFLIVLTSLLFSKDGKMIASQGFFANWTPQTLIPITTNAIGGIVVGLVTKYAGSVRKGFALIFGIFISGVFQALVGGSGIEGSQILGGVLAAVSLWMHTKYPYKKK